VVSGWIVIFFGHLLALVNYLLKNICGF